MKEQQCPRKAFDKELRESTEEKAVKLVGTGKKTVAGYPARVYRFKVVEKGHGFQVKRPQVQKALAAEGLLVAA